MRSFKTSGIVIKRRNFNESDRIITLYTKDFGKIQVKASGVRKITSRRSSHIEQLNFVEVGLYRGASLYTLTEAQMTLTYENVKGDLKKTGIAYHMCELIEGLCPENQEQAQIFLLFKQTLDKLEVSDENSHQTLIHEFEIRLLTLLGFWHGTDEVSEKLNTHKFIEEILERKLKSHRIFEQLDHIS